MILKGNQRGGAKQMALHLLNGEQNEHVTVHQVKGFMAGNILDALNEVHALSKGTQCRQVLYSVSLNPPKDETVAVEVFEEAVKKIEAKLGLVDQPRVIVFHEKEGRRHAHCVWSRIDLDEMKAINIADQSGTQESTPLHTDRRATSSANRPVRQDDQSPSPGELGDIGRPEISGVCTQ